MKNLIFILFIAFGLFLALYFYRQYALTQTALTLANQRILDRDRIIYNNQKQLDALKSRKPLSSQTSASPSSLGSLRPEDVASLQQKGLSNPEINLRDDLLRKQEILLPQGSPESTLAIQEVKVLTNRYALASFQIGSDSGYILLRFTVEPDKRITWKVLDYYRL